MSAGKGGGGRTASGRERSECSGSGHKGHTLGNSGRSSLCQALCALLPGGADPPPLGEDSGSAPRGLGPNPTLLLVSPEVMCLFPLGLSTPKRKMGKLPVNTS